MSGGHQLAGMAPVMVGSERSPGSPRPSPMLLCQRAVKAGDLQGVEAHVKLHGVAMLGKNGFQALHFAACYGQIEIAQFLVGAHASVNAQTTRGNTPLHIACFENGVPMLELLVQHGADTSVLNWQDKSPVDMALRARTLQKLVRALCRRSGGQLVDPSGKLWQHYYQLLALARGAREDELGPAFKRCLCNIFLKRDLSFDQRLVDLQEACEAYLVLRSRHNRALFDAGPTDDPIQIEFVDEEYLSMFVQNQMRHAIELSVPCSKHLAIGASGGMAAEWGQAVELNSDDVDTANVETCEDMVRARPTAVENIHVAWIPDSPLPEVSVVSASPGASLAVSSSSPFRGAHHSDGESIVMVSSPLVRFSSPGAALAMARQRRSRAPTNRGPLALGSLESPSSPASTYCGPTASRKFSGITVDNNGVDAASSDSSSSPVSVTALLSISQWRTLTPRARNLNQLGQDEQNDVDDVFVNTVSDDMYLAHTCDPDAKRHSASKASPLQPDLDTKKPDVAMMGQAIFAKQHQREAQRKSKDCLAASGAQLWRESLQTNQGRWLKEAGTTLVGVADESDGDDSQLLALLASILHQKNSEIQSLAASLKEALTTSDCLRLAVRDNECALKRVQREGALRAQGLAQRVEALEAQNESLRQHGDAAIEATRLQAQEQRVREYQALLDRAVADKLNIEQHMASCGLEAAARIGGCDELPAGGDCFWQRERQCTFNHQLPSSMALQLDSWCPANGRENCGRSTPLTSWSDLNAQHASDMLFTHNQILCKEVVRLRYELERASEASDPDSSSSRHGSSPDAGTSRSQSVSPDDVGLRQDADSSMQREALVSSLGRGGQTIAGYMSPQDKVPSCSPPAIPAGMSQLPYSCLSLEGGMEEGEGKVSCQLVEGAALSFAKATVLFASPPSQLGRTYEQLSEWV